jgi:hypothetical protein
MPFGKLNPTETKQYYQASGEATPQQQLPAKFQSAVPPPSPVTGRQTIAAEWLPDIKQSPVVNRRPRMVGMRYLYAHGTVRQPVERLGNSMRPAPNISRYQQYLHGPIHDAGFNDALFQAGYPGFNLGLSFKVQTLQTQGGARLNMKSPITISQTRTVNKLGRATGMVPQR